MTRIERAIRLVDQQIAAGRLHVDDAELAVAVVLLDLTGEPLHAAFAVANLCRRDVRRLSCAGWHATPHPEARA